MALNSVGSMPGFRHARRSLLAVTIVVLASCSTDDGRTMKPPSAGQTDTIATATTVGESVSDGSTMSVSGPWTSGDEIDPRYTCDGAGLSPSLSWTPGPEDTQAYAITISDIDDDSVISWVVTNIDFGASTSPEGSVPTGGVVARNTSGVAAYDPPCPKAGSTRTYVVSVYALDSLTPLADDPDAPTIIADIESAAIQAASTIFTVTR